MAFRPVMHAPMRTSDVAAQADSRRTLWIMAAIVALGLAVRIAFLSGFQGNDDRNYVAYAWTLANEGRIPLEHPTQWLGRLGFWVPLGAAFKVAGLTNWSLFWYPMACSLAGFVLLWKLGGLWFSETSRLFAALLLAVMPLDVQFASHAYPDLPLAFWMVLAFYLTLRGDRCAGPGTAWYLAAGTAAGIAYLNREDAVYLLAAFAGYLLWRRQLRAGYAWIVTAGLAVVLVEWSVWGLAANDPLFRYRAANSRLEVHEEIAGQQHSEEPGSRLDAIGTPAKLRRGSNPWTEPLLMFATNQEFGIIYLFVWPLAIWTLVRQKPGIELAIWLALIAACLAYFPLAYPHSLVRNPRYYCCLTIPALLLLGDWLARQRGIWKWSLTGLVLASSLTCIVLDSSRFAMDGIRMANAFLDRNREVQRWMGPKEGMFQFVIDGGTCRETVGIHLLTAGRDSARFQNLLMVCPHAPVAESIAQISSGFVVLGPSSKEKDDLHKELGSRCSLVQTVTPEPSPLIKAGVSTLESIGVPAKYTQRLLPNRGGETEIWLVREQTAN